MKFSNNSNSPLKVKSWVSTDGQLTYTFDTGSYKSGQITVYVGGVPQFSGMNFQEDSRTSFTLLCEPSDIPAGVDIIANYR